MTTDTRTAIEKVADSSIAHGWINRYDVPDAQSGRSEFSFARKSVTA